MMMNPMESSEYYVFSAELNQDTHVEGMREYGRFDLLILEWEIENVASLKWLRIGEEVPYDPMIAMINDIVTDGRATKRFVKGAPKYARGNEGIYMNEDKKAGGTMRVMMTSSPILLRKNFWERHIQEISGKWDEQNGKKDNGNNLVL